MAAVRLPASNVSTTPPLFKSSTRLKPAAIPVIDGCGVIILRRAIVLLLGLGVRRRATRRRGEVVALRRPRRARRQAFLLTPPAALIAHLGSLLTLTTQWTGRQSHLSQTDYISKSCTKTKTAVFETCSHVHSKGPRSAAGYLWTVLSEQLLKVPALVAYVADA